MELLRNSSTFSLKMNVLQLGPKIECSSLFKNFLHFLKCSSTFGPKLKNFPIPSHQTPRSSYTFSFRSSCNFGLQVNGGYPQATCRSLLTPTSRPPRGQWRLLSSYKHISYSLIFFLHVNSSIDPQFALLEVNGGCPQATDSCK